MDKLLNGFITGISSTFIFNPFDKAIYLMVKDNKPIYDKNIWKNPYKGVTHALYNRVLSYGFFYPLNDYYNNYFNVPLSGIMASSSVAILNNPLNVIKLYNWNNNSNQNFVKLFNKLRLEHGMKIFMYKLHYTLIRDSIFGGVFITLSHYYNQEKSLLKDTIYGALATSLSSPINYFRNRAYFDLNKSISIQEMIRELKNDIKKNNYNRKQILKYLVLDKFCINYGTLRVGLGMALSKKIYNFLEKK